MQLPALAEADRAATANAKLLACSRQSFRKNEGSPRRCPLAIGEYAIPLQMQSAAIRIARHSTEARVETTRRTLSEAAAGGGLDAVDGGALHTALQTKFAWGTLVGSNTAGTAARLTVASAASDERTSHDSRERAHANRHEAIHVEGLLF